MTTETMRLTFYELNAEKEGEFRESLIERRKGRNKCRNEGVKGMKVEMKERKSERKLRKKEGKEIKKERGKGIKERGKKN